MTKSRMTELIMILGRITEDRKLLKVDLLKVANYRT
jgi:hypothetical protein